jgi:hypothetical protein
MIAKMRTWVLALLISAGGTAGCGPIAYVQTVPTEASHAVDRARAAQADKYAPYWWTRATQYLHMAREVAAHADYQGANRFGRLATQAANNAVTEAEIVEKDPSKGPIDATKDAAPAKDSDAPAPAKDDGVAPAKDTP